MKYHQKVVYYLGKVHETINNLTFVLKELSEDQNSTVEENFWAPGNACDFK